MRILKLKESKYKIGKHSYEIKHNPTSNDYAIYIDRKHYLDVSEEKKTHEIAKKEIFGQIAFDKIDKIGKEIRNFSKKYNWEITQDHSSPNYFTVIDDDSFELITLRILKDHPGQGTSHDVEFDMFYEPDDGTILVYINLNDEEQKIYLPLLNYLKKKYNKKNLGDI